MRSGGLYFGSSDGLYSFRPAEVAAVPPPRAPAVVLTSLRVFGASEKRVPLSDLEEVKLPYGDNSFSLEFAVLDFTSPTRHTYEYRLAGVNDRWSSLGLRRDVTFSRLEPGSYTFFVKATTAAESAEAAGAPLRITIEPPFWSTWWWRLACGAALVLLLAILHRARVRRLQARERELKTRVDDALSRVKVLRGVLPVCPTCKKVKDDRGYWEWIERYVRERTEADFSHSICPACMGELYPEYVSALFPDPPRKP
jgi:hypothetical protein